VSGDPIRVLLAEDQSMLRGAMAALLSMEVDLDVVGQVASGDAVVPEALRVRPDVAVLDIEMPGLDGLSAAAALRIAAVLLPDFYLPLLWCSGLLWTFAFGLFVLRYGALHLGGRRA